ncbi:hypothetical protein ABBQ32_001812 [Trebouxia sp. C0010 RCD-2024]
MAPERFRQLKDRYKNMKSGGGVLCVAALQLIVGIVLLGIYEGYKMLGSAFIFFNFLLSIAATVFATKAIEEIKVKQREEYNRLSVLSDTLQYEVSSSAVKEDRALFQQSLAAFITANEDPTTSPNFKSKVTDLPGPLFQLLEQTSPHRDQDLILLLLKVLKILSRRKDNRLQIGRQGIQSVFQHLSSIVSKPIAAEAANIILNVCYERASVALVVQCQGVETLVSCLSDSNADLQANAAGAIQSICFQEQGRKAVGDAGAVSPLISLLDSAHGKVRSRAVGALHNLSSDSTSIRTIRRSGGIPKLVALLK